MKIVIGTNTYGNYDRQQIAVDSWKHLAATYPGVSLLNVQFDDERDSFDLSNNIPTVFDLKRSSKTYIANANKKLPFVNDIIHSIYKQDCDYMIFTNSDVIINSSLIDYIHKNEPNAMACSRLDIQPISSFKRLREEIVPVRWEVAGFDTFVFKKTWYQDHREYFGSYLYGKPVWDPVYALICKAYGGNVQFGNKNPAFCMHIHHGQESAIECPEKDYNVNYCKRRNFDSLACGVMNLYIKHHLIRRQPPPAFLHEVDQEAEIEHAFFNEVQLG